MLGWGRGGRDRELREGEDAKTHFAEGGTGPSTRTELHDKVVSEILPIMRNLANVHQIKTIFYYRFLIEHPAAFAAHLINWRRMSDRGQQKEESRRRGDASDGRQDAETPDLQHVWERRGKRRAADQSDLIDFAIECTDQYWEIMVQGDW